MIPITHVERPVPVAKFLHNLEIATNDNDLVIYD